MQNSPKLKKPHKNFRCHKRDKYTKFCRNGNLAPGICIPLDRSIMMITMTTARWTRGVTENPRHPPPLLTEPRSKVPRSQEQTTVPSTVPKESTPQRSTTFLYDPF